MEDTSESGNLMDLFEQEGDFELNFSTSPDDYQKEQPEEEIESEDDSEDINSSEDQNDPEEVAGEEEGQEEEGENTDDEESDEVSPDDNLYSSFASVLSEKGLLPSIDLDSNKIKSVDDLTETLKQEIQIQSRQYLINKVGEDGLEALERGISLAELQQYNNNVNTLDNITKETIEGDLDLAKQLIKQDYLSQGMDERRVNRILKKSIDLGEEVIIEDAMESLESLKLIQARQLEKLAEERRFQEEQNRQLQEKIDNDLKSSIYNDSEYFKDMKVNKDIQDRVYKSITQVVSQDPNTGVAENRLMKDRRENPIEFDKRLYYLYEITDGFKNINKLISKSESKAANSLEKILRNNKFETSGKPSFMDDPDSYDGPSGELVF